MSAQLYIRIVDTNQMDYAVVNAAGVMEQAGTAFHHDQLPNLPRDLPTILLVPGADVLLLTANLPKTSAAQLRRAVPYAIEEQLIDAVEDLHFAIGKQDSQGDVLVAVVKKQLMQAWLAQCAQWQFTPSVMLPDFLAVPALDNTWHVYCDRERALIRQTAHQGMNVPREQLADMLRLSINAGTVDLPTALQLDYDDGNEEFVAEGLGALPIVVNIAPDPEFCMNAFFGHGKQPVPINLLQAEFSVTRDLDKKSRWLKVVAGLVIAWCVIWLAGSIAQYVVYKVRLSKAQNHVTVLYKQAFPQAKDVVDPQLRVQRALLDAQANAGGGAFLGLLTRVGQQLTAQQHTVTVNNINYRDQTLTLSVTAPNFQTLSNLVQALQKNNLQVQQQNAQTDSQKQTVNAQLIIK